MCKHIHHTTVHANEEIILLKSLVNVNTLHPTFFMKRYPQSKVFTFTSESNQKQFSLNTNKHIVSLLKTFPLHHLCHPKFALVFRQKKCYRLIEVTPQKVHEKSPFCELAARCASRSDLVNIFSSSRFEHRPSQCFQLAALRAQT